MQSMTGFAREPGELDGTSWVWELKSVNGKGLDLRFRMPPGFDAVEAAARKLADKRLGRGNVQINLQTSRKDREKVPVINLDAVDVMLETSRAFAEKKGEEPPTIADILAIRGLVELEEAALDEKAKRALEAAMIESFQKALDELVSARSQEGAAMAAVLGERLQSITHLLDQIEQNTDRSPQAIQERLNQQVARLMADHSDKIDPQRLHQEVTLLATKADIQEELDRLGAHIASAGNLLNASGPIGRKLDFLSQEFNRECNTICSKSNSATISALGVDMKLVIDQFREQVQNLE